MKVLKIAILAEKFALDYTWYVDIILNLIRYAGQLEGGREGGREGREGGKEGGRGGREGGEGRRGGREGEGGGALYVVHVKFDA